MKNKVPHAYNAHNNSCYDLKHNGRAFTKEKRFLIQAQKERNNTITPAPDHYNSHLYNSISSTQYGRFFSRTNSLDARRSKENTTTEKFNKKQYYSELEKGYYHSISPGPGAYNNGTEITKSLSHVRKSFDPKFSKVWLLSF